MSEPTRRDDLSISIADLWPEGTTLERSLSVSTPGATMRIREPDANPCTMCGCRWLTDDTCDECGAAR